LSHVTENYISEDLFTSLNFEENWLIKAFSLAYPITTLIFAKRLML